MPEQDSEMAFDYRLAYARFAASMEALTLCSGKFDLPTSLPQPDGYSGE